MKHPLQIIARGADGVIRFRANSLVQQLLASYPGGSEALRSACPNADVGDWDQLEQQLGWSVAGYGDLPYVSRESVEAANTVADTVR